MALSDSENMAALNHVDIQVKVDCFTPHEVTYLLVGQMICHEGRVVSQRL